MNNFTEDIYNVTNGSCEAQFSADECSLRHNQKLYFTLAIAGTGISTIFLAFSLREYVYNPAFQRAPLKYFICLILADVLGVVTFFPYHLRNLFLLNGTDGPLNLEDSNFYCHLTFILSVFYILSSLLSYLVIPYFPYKMLTTSASRSVEREYRKVMKIYLGITLLISFSMIPLAFLNDEVGSHYGLYCGVREYNNSQGVCLMFLVSVVFLLIGYLYWSSYKILRAHYSHSTSLGAVTKEQVEPIIRAAKNILKTGLKMIIAFALTWGCITVSVIISFIGSTKSPITFEMLSGNLIKWKPVMDTLLLFQMYRQQKKIIALRSTARSKARTNQTSHYTKKSSYVQDSVMIS